MSNKKFAILIALLSLATMSIVIVFMVVVFSDANDHSSVTGKPSGRSVAVSLGNTK